VPVAIAVEAESPQSAAMHAARGLERVRGDATGCNEIIRHLMDGCDRIAPETSLCGFAKCRNRHRTAGSEMPAGM
jgi:hypothetical protein